ncbi:MAG: cellulose binding domain-containing protein, partial [Clostridiales bacterium]
MSNLHIKKKSITILSILGVLTITMIAITISINASADDTVLYEINNDWGNGATINVVIQNLGSSDINGWTVEWTFSGNQNISTMWNATYAQTNKSVIVKNNSWNSVIPTNSSTSFGFNLTYSGENSIPSNIIFNGTSANQTTEPTTTTSNDNYTETPTNITN